MDIGFIWDEEKYKVVSQTHSVKFYEVVSAFDDLNGYEVPPIQPDMQIAGCGSVKLLTIGY